MEILGTHIFGIRFRRSQEERELERQNEKLRISNLEQQRDLLIEQKISLEKKIQEMVARRKKRTEEAKQEALRVHEIEAQRKLAKERAEKAKEALKIKHKRLLTALINKVASDDLDEVQLAEVNLAIIKSKSELTKFGIELPPEVDDLIQALKEKTSGD